MDSCTFCGNRAIYCHTDTVWNRTYNAICTLAAQGCINFYVGNYGAFDRMAAHACIVAKKKYPSIQVFLVLPYYNPTPDEAHRKYYEKFDCTIVPEQENVPYAKRILGANRYMVDHCSSIIAYVHDSTGGAAKTMAYAEKRGLTVIRVDDSVYPWNTL